MKKDKYKTVVIFRKFKDGQIIALFPYEVDIYNHNCSSYMHIGQHSGANYSHCIQITKPANKIEYKALFYELEQIGYNLEIKQKFNYREYCRAYNKESIRMSNLTRKSTNFNQLNN